MRDDAPATGFQLHLVSDQSKGNGPDGQAGDPTRGEIQDYIADMLEELRDLARTSGLKSLAAVLEFATRCAQSQAGKSPGAGRGR